MDDKDHGHSNHDSQQPHHHGEGEKSKFRPSIQAVFSNWNRSEEPFLFKLGMVLRNNWIKLRRGSSCCGHHGEVGC